MLASEDAFKQREPRHTHGPTLAFTRLFGLAVSMSVRLSTLCATKMKLVSEPTELFSLIQQDVEGDPCPLVLPKKGPLGLAKLQWVDLETSRIRIERSV